MLLPDTPLTQNILNQHTLNLLKRGAFVLNPGRGPLIDDDALLAALETGQIEHATLDVFRIEPLPKIISTGRIIKLQSYLTKLPRQDQKQHHKSSL